MILNLILILFFHFNRNIRKSQEDKFGNSVDRWRGSSFSNSSSLTVVTSKVGVGALSLWKTTFPSQMGAFFLQFGIK